MDGRLLKVTLCRRIRVSQQRRITNFSNLHFQGPNTYTYILLPLYDPATSTPSLIHSPYLPSVARVRAFTLGEIHRRPPPTSRERECIKAPDLIRTVQPLVYTRYRSFVYARTCVYVHIYSGRERERVCIREHLLIGRNPRAYRSC